MSSTPLDSSVPWTRQRAEALSETLSSIMHVGPIHTLTALKKPTAIWVTKISSIFQFWLLLYEGGSHVPRVCVMCVCAQVSASVQERMCVCVQGQLEVCCWTPVLDLLTNHLNLVQAGVFLRVWVTELMSSFHAVLRSLARRRCRFTVLLLQICVLECMCRIKAPIEGRWGIHSKRGTTPLRGRKQEDNLLPVRNLYQIVLWKWPGVGSSDLHLCPCQKA